jgi:PKHD-type hydroxylase
MVLQPASSVHRVQAVTHGARVASFCRIESRVRDHAQRGLVFDLDTSILGLRGNIGNTPEVHRLTGCHHKLLRLWADC